ncbi:DUF1990 family protein, partial [Arthrobacter sp. AOP36-C1-22]|uniref:DUF1990 family protein n=1 Tax=Arthrobacter sp. AOP36-C1-22 TaxID=3457683 RepID=UPI00403361B0
QTVSSHEFNQRCWAVQLDDEGTVWFEVLAYSKPANWLMRAAAPVTHRTQEWVTRAYFESAERLADGRLS